MKKKMTKTPEEMISELEDKFKGLKYLLERKYNWQGGDSYLKNSAMDGHRWTMAKEGRNLTLALNCMRTFHGAGFQGKQIRSVIRQAHDYFIVKRGELIVKEEVQDAV